ncbi:unnamed protein product [Gongylonema pulchrum]|uniref:Uncharacterized protein n=1 Tax=Gongylonema pulchrum TaxID=637853 RepID=A0A183EQH4_9BILA|nr:unnamed protein product [Gongylonema pulchrum]
MRYFALGECSFFPRLPHLQASQANRSVVDPQVQLQRMLEQVNNSATAAATTTAAPSQPITNGGAVEQAHSDKGASTTSQQQ